MNKQLKNDLLARRDVDQEMRNRAAKDGFAKWNSSIDEDNTSYLQTVVAEHGWPKISDVGEEAAGAAWLLVQHADHNPDFQATCLALMHALPEHEIKLSNIAYLEDRVRVARGEPQLYGTQFLQVEDTIMPSVIFDEENLDKRRAAMGLKPFAVYNQQMIDKCTASSQPN